MISDNFYIFKKEVDWSLLHEGFSIPISIQIHFHEYLNHYLKRGEQKTVKLVIENNQYDVILKNQAFDEKKYPTHKDIIQIRYSPQSPISIKLREVFHNTYKYLRKIRLHRPTENYSLIKIPEEFKEYISLYSTHSDNEFFVDCITHSDFELTKSFILKHNLTEEIYVNTLYFNKTDKMAQIYEKQQLIKLRRLDRSIGEALKLLYEFKCQICGENFGSIYNTNVIETHHIDHFVDSLNNDSDNILIICPNHHRVIHKTNPQFIRSKMELVYPNSYIEKIQLNKHL